MSGKFEERKTVLCPNGEAPGCGNAAGQAEIDGALRVTKSVIRYFIAAINDFAKRHQLTAREASNYLQRYGGLAFLTQCYEGEHTLSMYDCVDDLTFVCQKYGGALQ